MKHVLRLRKCILSLKFVTRWKMFHKVLFFLFLLLVTLALMWTKLNFHTFVINSAQHLVQDEVTFPVSIVPLAYLTKKEPDISAARCFRYPQYVHLKFSNMSRDQRKDHLTYLWERLKTTLLFKPRFVLLVDNYRYLYQKEMF